MFSAGSLLSSGFHIGSLPWSGDSYLALLLSTFVNSVVLSIVLWARDRFAHLNRVFSLSRLLVPPLSRAALFPWWVPRPGMGSLLNFGFSLEPCQLRFFLTLRLLFLAVLESERLWVVLFEEAVYKCSIWMNELYTFSPIEWSNGKWHTIVK